MKKLISLLLSFMMMYSCLHNGAVVPMQVNAMQGNMVFARARYEVCQCGGKMITKVEPGDWVRRGREKCSHGHPLGEDLFFERPVHYTKQCVDCGLGTFWSRTESKTVCQGHSNWQ